MFGKSGEIFLIGILKINVSPPKRIEKIISKHKIPL